MCEVLELRSEVVGWDLVGADSV